jgi:hypothetical protein
VVSIDYVLVTVLSLMAISLAFRESPFSRLAEHMAVGIGGGNGAVRAIKYIYTNGAIPIMEEGAIDAILWVLIASLLYFSLSRRTRYIARLPVAIATGVNLGLPVAMIQTQVIKQIEATTVNIISSNPVDTFTAIVVAIAVVTTMSFFIFSRKQTGASGSIQRIGRYFLMLFFGLQVGQSTMGAMSRVAERVLYILGQI